MKTDAGVERAEGVRMVQMLMVNRQVLESYNGIVSNETLESVRRDIDAAVLRLQERIRILDHNSELFREELRK